MLKPTIALTAQLLTAQLLTTLISGAACSQDALRPQIPVESVPKGHLEHARYLEMRIMQAYPEPVGKAGILRLGDLTTRQGKAFVDFEVPVNFVAAKKPLAFKLALAKACVHNIEISPIWRLRRATFERQAGNADKWIATELVFGYRRTSAKGQGAFEELPSGKAAVWELAKLVLTNETKHATLRSITLDLTEKAATINAKVQVLGKDYRKRFHEFETAAAVTCLRAKGAFQDVHWRGDEQPIKGKSGSLFTLDFRLRTK